MAPQTQTILWLVGGVLLMVAELAAPGMVVIFLGAGALLVAGVRALGLVDSLSASFVLWLLSSIVLAVTLRGALQRWSHPERSCQSTDEDADAFDHEVEVVERIGPDESAGRIRFRGTTWLARAAGGAVLEPGSRARIVHRENLAWIVEPTVSSLPTKIESRTDQDAGAVANGPGGRS